MRTLHYYNPEVDLAMAGDSPSYTAPRNIVRMQRQNALLPALYALQGDMILLPEGLTPEELPSLIHYPVAESKGLAFVTFTQLNALDFANVRIQPWGWSRSLRHKLIKHGVPEVVLPSQMDLDTLRMLCHRRTTINANLHPAFDFLRDRMPPVPIEFDDAQEAMSWALEREDIFFKAPWSSSGHGIFHLSARETPPEYLEGRRRLAMEWLTGTISRQGSAMAEVGITRLLDCATEWWIHSPQRVEFIGWSVFNADSNGHYLGNIRLPQRELKRLVEDAIKTANGEIEAKQIIAAQKQMLEDLIAPDYQGPVGVDMIIGEEGMPAPNVIAPCVELNLRMTQGIVYTKL